jgi:cytochrome P450
MALRDGRLAMSDETSLATPPGSQDPKFCEPARPQAPYFDSTLRAWVLSRYDDVLAAFYEPRLRLVGSDGEGDSEVENNSAQSPQRAETLAALTASRLAHWHAQIQHLASEMVAALPADRPVDVIDEYARPLCLKLAVMVTGADPEEAERLSALAYQISIESAALAARDSDFKSKVAAVSAELERALVNKGMPMAGPAFVALSQTLPCFLANAWLALLEHPAELRRLRDQPEVMPKAIEELLRYAGLVRILFRKATENANVGNVDVARGDRLALLVAVANRDPAKFEEPDRVDIRRHAVAQFSLGAGPHSCVGASLIRLAAAAATAAFASRFAAAKLCGPIEWRGGLESRWPASLLLQ